MAQRRYEDRPIFPRGETMARQQYEDISTALHGIPMTEEGFEQLLSVESPYRYELIDGMIYNMTGSTPEHSAIAVNIVASLRGQLGAGGPCRVHMDQYVKIPDRPPCCPDVVVTCDVADWEKKKRLKPFKIQYPRIVVEVLSPSTQDYDHKGKFARYRRCPSLEVYLLVSQDERQVEVFRKQSKWKREIFSGEQVISLDATSEDTCPLQLSLEEMYQGVIPEVE
ncbi:MAG TPA: Uma2 family endonuclease [Ktedonosporobacter sp.]|nr:Uma2 family endonuclease [Ktedonosporobacter sp.]